MRNVHPINPRLDRVDFTLHLPRQENDFYTTVTAIGSSELRRSHLWVVSESWARDRNHYDYDAAQNLHHIALVCISDKPNTRDMLDRQMRGLEHPDSPPWAQPELPL